MSNARMTFRFGDNESDKPENKGIPTSSTFAALSEEIPHSPTPTPTQLNTTPSWTPEEIPGDWGETMLTGSTVPEPYPRTDKDSKLDEPGYSYKHLTAYPGEEDENRSDENYGGHDWLADSENYSYKRNRPPRGWKMIGSVTGALVTGALFGMVILSFFNREGAVDPGSKMPANQEVSAVTGQQGVAGSEQQLQATTTGGSYYALQYGVFSSPERAEQAKVELSQAGIAAGSDPEDGNRVYAGISADREEAKLLSSRLKAEGVELYVKEIVNPEVNPAVFGGKAEDVKQFFASGSALVEQLSTLSIQQLGQSVPEAVSTETMTSLQNQHQLWLTGLNSIAPGLSADVQPYVSAMEKSMNSAVTAIAEYNKNPANVYMWSVQSDLMEYVLQQKKWLEAIKQ
ncbi:MULTISPECIES: SPOR domain-containing protein [unclassified Paenibacillus]|uniref:SPOR domain-containing protein n=1 Tax=unclassified Paenibacillus TaxID=185978 RepID=UPI0008B788D9|nr:SPOR domain-containing protein [Paenibacillus sp. OK076]SEP07299.1 Sporulation related domain-containing protein [Paenibacillus sp. OK076]